MDRLPEALSAAGIPSTAGGASPLPAPVSGFSDDWNYNYFMVVPLMQIKPYNHEVVTRMIHRIILEELGDFNREAFPPVLESWINPMSMCVKIVCTRKVFERMARGIRGIYADFGGAPEMFLSYQTSGAIQ